MIVYLTPHFKSVLRLNSVLLTGGDSCAVLEISLSNCGSGTVYLKTEFRCFSLGESSLIVMSGKLGTFGMFVNSLSTRGEGLSKGDLTNSPLSVRTTTHLCVLTYSPSLKVRSALVDLMMPQFSVVMSLFFVFMSDVSPAVAMSLH